MEINNITRKPGETNAQLALRVYDICQREDPTMTFPEFGQVMNDITGLDYIPNSWRKAVRKEQKRQYGASTKDIKNSIRNKINEVKIRDERNLSAAYIRALSREDTCRDIANNAVKKLKNKLLPEANSIRHTGKRRAILCISDWHYGIEIDNYWNKYNTTICKQRVAELQSNVEDYIKLWDVETLYVFNLSDLIAGRIHNQIRLDSRIDCITQIMEVSEILAEFLSNLSTKVNIVYQAVSDNHSQLEPNKKERWEPESLTKITHWFLKERLANNKHIVICDNQFSEDIATCKIYDFNVVATHGHKDKFNRIVNSLSPFLRDKLDLILVAHNHHFSGDEYCTTAVIRNGSLMGTDDYAAQLRQVAVPSQNLIIVEPNNIMKALHKINL